MRKKNPPCPNCGHESKSTIFANIACPNCGARNLNQLAWVIAPALVLVLLASCIL